MFIIDAEEKHTIQTKVIDVLPHVNFKLHYLIATSIQPKTILHIGKSIHRHSNELYEP